MKRIWLFSGLIALLVVGCTPVVEKKKVEKKPSPPPVRKPELKAVEAPQILRKGPGRISSRPYVPGTILLETEWNQGFPYNKRLPALGQERVVTGCVNTALAQVLYYYRYPLSARGIARHRWNRQELTANLYRNYNWDIIPVTTTAETPAYQIDELAALFRDLGITNGTRFNITSNGGSGASFNTAALAENFGFSKDIKSMKNDNPLFLQTIKAEIDRRRVVLLSISGRPSGHMTVIDGYRRDADGLKFHINMGWGGTDNDFYDLSRRIVPKSRSDKNSMASDYSFTRELKIFYNIVPCRGTDCYRNLEPDDRRDGFQIRGKFNNRRDKDIYKNLYLGGPTTIRGDRGYGNQAFYIKILDDDNRLVAVEAPKSKVFQINLNPGRYAVVVSLCKQKKNGRTCFGDDPEYRNYEVHIQTRPVAAVLKSRINAQDSAPVMAGRFPNMILNKEFKVHRIRVDASDPDADPLTLRAFTNLYDANIRLAWQGNILSITPNDPASNTTSNVTIQAVANKKTATRSFRILFSAATVAFGREFDIGGRFISQESRNRHKVILQGNCAIQGYNGFKNQAFYLDILDAEGKPRYQKPVDTGIRDRFQRGTYYIESMLKFTRDFKSKQGRRTSTWAYKYRQGIGDTYNIHVSCPDFDESLALLENDNRDVPPKIITELPDLILGNRFAPVHIPVEAMDSNGDDIQLSVRSTAPGIRTVLQGSRLTLYPASRGSVRKTDVVLTASANGQQVRKRFTVFLEKESIAFGRRFKVNGTIRSQKDIQTHPVILSGQCRITGNNGYSNQAFYTSVKDSNHSRIVDPVNQEIRHDFREGIYYLTAALINERGRYYSYQRGKGDSYTIHIECPGMNTLTSHISSLLNR